MAVRLDWTSHYNQINQQDNPELFYTAAEGSPELAGSIKESEARLYAAHQFLLKEVDTDTDGHIEVSELVNAGLTQDAAVYLLSRSGTGGRLNENDMTNSIAGALDEMDYQSLWNAHNSKVKDVRVNKYGKWAKNTLSRAEYDYVVENNSNVSGSGSSQASTSTAGDQYVPKGYLEALDDFTGCPDHERAEKDLNYGIAGRSDSASALAAAISIDESSRPSLNSTSDGYMFDSNDAVIKSEFTKLGFNDKAWETLFPGKTEVSQDQLAAEIVKLDKLDGKEDGIILANVKKHLNNGEDVIRSYMMSDNTLADGQAQFAGTTVKADAEQLFNDSVTNVFGSVQPDDKKLGKADDAKIAELLGLDDVRLATAFRQKYGTEVNGHYEITPAKIREIVMEWDASDDENTDNDASTTFYDGIITAKHIDDAGLPDFQIRTERTPTAPPNGNSGSGSNGAGNTTTNTNPDPNDVYTTEEQRQQQAQQSSTQRRQQRQAPLTGMARVKQAVSQSILPAALATLLFVLLGQNKSQSAQASYYQPPTWMPTYFGGIGNSVGNTNVFASQFNQQWGNGNMMNNFFA